ncbi:transposase [Peptococcus simiae]|uniref:transposase n=1 Tax=Peptococcus simiae TaxID=1643805 RepID=UPI00397EE73A
MKAYFYRFQRKERKKVKGIIIDMFHPYIELIRQLFPNAEIIIDHFHLVQTLNREHNRYRVQWMNQIRHKDGKLYRKLKRYWKLLLINPDKLTRYRYDRFRLFDHLTNTGNIVATSYNKTKDYRRVITSCIA